MVTKYTGRSGKHKKLAHLIENGNFNDALILATEITQAYPHDTTSWYMLAGIYSRLGKLDETVECCKKVTELNPRHAGAYYNLAVGLQQKGNLPDAAYSYRQCLRIEPHNIQALMNLGMILGSQGNHLDALKLFENAAEADPHHFEAFYYQGVQLQAIGRLDDAVAAYQKAIQIQPHFFKAQNNLGHIYNELGELNKALDIFNSLIKSNPASAEVHNNLGVVYESMGKIQEAESAYRQAITLNPALTDTRSHLGFLLSNDGRTHEALECFDANLALDPGHESSVAGKATVLEKLGKIAESCSTLESSSINTTSNPDLVLAYCTTMLRQNDTANAIRQAERLLSTGRVPPKGAADLSFALGDLYEHDGDYARAFRYFEDANRLSPCTYSHERHLEYINNIIRLTTKDALRRTPRARHEHGIFIFIVGMPRSGTSLTEQILASHPEVFGAGELRFLSDIAASFSPPLTAGSKYPSNIAGLAQSDVDILAMRYIEQIKVIAGNSRFITDKMPHNFLYLGLIAILFPRARIIHVRRSPLDNCLSLFFHGFNPMHSYTTDLELLGRYYREYLKLMDHWRQVLDIPVLEIDYEDIVNNLESSTKRLLDFCQLDWSDNCLEFHKNDRLVKTPSYDQVRKPIYTSSVNRWKHYQDYMAPLVDALSLE